MFETGNGGVKPEKGKLLSPTLSHYFAITFFKAVNLCRLYQSQVQAPYFPIFLLNTLCLSLSKTSEFECNAASDCYYFQIFRNQVKKNYQD